MRTEPAHTTDAVLPRATPSGVLPIPKYDVRIRQELAQRRLLRAVARTSVRIGLIHLADALAIVVAASLASLTGGDLRTVIAPLLGLTLLALHACGAYGPHRLQAVGRIALAVGIACATSLAITRFPPHTDVSVGFTLIYGLAATLGLVATHHSLQLAIRAAHKRGMGLRKAVIVGRHAEVRAVSSALETDEHTKHEILGFVSPARQSDPRSLGSIEEIETILDRFDPGEVILSGSLDAAQLRRVADACVRRGVSILAVPSWGRAIRGWAEPVLIGPLPGFRVHPARIGMPGLALKRCTDLVITSIGAVVVAPLMALIAVAIKLDSRGPVFYKQRRVGLGGREFMMWKFRSMRVKADASLDEVAHLNSYPNQLLFKAERDPRVTRIGRILRRFSLDELPQIFNVLSGDMSLVGPRPPVPHEVRRYDRRHYIRLSVVPGMTGPWQVNGRNLIRDFEEVVRLEKGYIESWSLREDVRIMIKTVGVVLSGKGAY